jgi:FkbM family methyltransferase
MKKTINKFLVWLLARPLFYKFNKKIYLLALNGLGILNFKTSEISGERSFLTRITRNFEAGAVVLDVGANVGNYSHSIKKLIPETIIYAFEPHPKTFKILQENAIKNKYIALNLGCGKSRSKLELYDYEDKDGSSHASLYRDAITNLRQCNSVSHIVDIIDLDSFLSEQSIQKVSLLKIDVEGNEYSVLEGLKESINKDMIEIIHFEFNEMNVFSKTFFKDFYDLLNNYRFFRLLPNHLLPLDKYSPLFCEIFAYQNIVAIHKNNSLSMSMS